MTPDTRCESCGGEYATHQADGMDYFHACPPENRIAVVRADEPITVGLGELRADDLVRVRRGDAPIDVLARDIGPDDVRLGDVRVERADKRDENVTEAIVDGKRTRAPKADGAGVVKL